MDYINKIAYLKGRKVINASSRVCVQYYLARQPDPVKVFTAVSFGGRRRDIWRESEALSGAGLAASPRRMTGRRAARQGCILGSLIMNAFVFNSLMV